MNLPRLLASGLGSGFVPRAPGTAGALLGVLLGIPLLLAPPGAGKGTQGERLAAWSGARHIAAGDLLRAEARAAGQLGREIAAYQARGDLVPDQIVLDVPRAHRCR